VKTKAMHLSHSVRCLFLCALLFSSVSIATADVSKQTSHKPIVELLKEGLGIPWGMTFVSPDELLFTERSGAVKVLNLRNKKLTNLSNVPRVLAEGQGGMLDVALSPNYKNDQWIYFTYVKDIDGEGATTLVRAKLARAKLKNYSLNSWQELLVTDSTTDTSQHYGSRIAFDESGHVYFGIGDRGVRPNSQNLTNHSGAIIRLNLDGSIPKDNPFVGNINALDEIWSYGHRNPQGLVYAKYNKRLWEIEHGPRGGDEINRIEKGKNYGWPVISYGKEYWAPMAVGEGTHKAGMEQPVKVYVPSIAPGSLMMYSGNAFPQWKNNLFSGALKLRHINRVVLSDSGEAIHEERLFEDLDERIRALTQSDEGFIYFSTDSGKIYKVSP